MKAIPQDLSTSEKELADVASPALVPIAWPARSVASPIAPECC